MITVGRRGAHFMAGALVAGALLVFSGIGPCATAAPDQVLRATLDNGLRVIIVRNTLAPVAATAVNYLVGSDEAPDGFPGTAHAQEHMMFRGSPGLSADQLADIGSAMGGSSTPTRARRSRNISTPCPPKISTWRCISKPRACRA